MRWPRWTGTSILALACLLCAPLVFAASTTPYAALYEVLEPARQLEQYDRLLALETVESTLDGVAPESIQLLIRSKSGDIAVPIGKDGKIEFPLTDALLAENPLVHSNQPKGSLTLSFSVALKLPAARRIDWADLHAALQQARAVIGQQSGSDLANKVAGAEFHFNAKDEASITLVGKGERLLLADPAGRIVIMDDATSAAEQPVLLLSHTARQVIPYLRP